MKRGSFMMYQIRSATVKFRVGPVQQLVYDEYKTFKISIFGVRRVMVV